jgi:hypothetical protein
MEITMKDNSTQVSLCNEYFRILSLFSRQFAWDIPITAIQMKQTAALMASWHDQLSRHSCTEMPQELSISLGTIEKEA